jgi:hypothetical protein
MRRLAAAIILWTRPALGFASDCLTCSLQTQISIRSPPDRTPVSSTVVCRVASLLQFSCEQPIDISIYPLSLFSA